MEFSPDSRHQWFRWLGKLVFMALGVGVAAAALVFTTELIGPLSLRINQTTAQKQATFDVTGKSQLYTVPDQAEINVGATITQSNVAAAQKEANRIINAIISDLKQQSIAEKDIKTTQYSIYPQYDYTGTSQRITGYNVNVNLSIKIRDLEKINQALDIAVTRGANQVQGVQFVLSQEKEQELTKQARDQAISDAKRNAQELAQLAGMKLGRIVNVVEHDNQVMPPIPLRSMAVAEGLGGGGDTNVQPGSTTITFSVTVSYETL